MTRLAWNHGGKRNRAIATGYDKLAVRYEATVTSPRSANGSAPAS